MAPPFPLPQSHQLSSACHFLTRLEIVTVQFYRNPALYQRPHHLQVTMNHKQDGLFRLAVTDHEVRKLLDLAGGDRGWRALIGALNRVTPGGRFEYDAFRPRPDPYRWYRMSFTERVLYLFFSTASRCSAGWMFRVRNGGSGCGFAEEEVQLEEFNGYLHSGGGREGADRSGAVDFGDLSEGVDDFVRERMRKLKEKLA